MEQDGFRNSSKEIFEHILQSKHDVSAVNSQLIEKYILLVKLGSEDNNDIKKVLTIIREVMYDENYIYIDSDGILLELIEGILMRLPVEQTFEIYPAEFILSYLKEGDPKISSMIVKVLAHNVAENEVKRLLEESELLKILLRKNFEKNSSLELSSLFEFLMRNINEQAGHLVKAIFFDLDFLSIFDEIVKYEDKRKARFLDFLLIVVPVLLKEKVLLPPKYYVFLKASFTENDDILLTMLRIQFYVRFVSAINNSGEESVMFENIKPSLEEIINLFSRRHDDETVAFFLGADMIHLLYHLSYSNIALVIRFLDETADKTALLQLHNLMLDSDLDKSLLSTYNPERFPETLEDSILEELLLFSQNYLEIFFNLLGSKSFFEKAKPLLTFNSISNLTFDKLYGLLLKLSERDYSAYYLLRDLPRVVADYLVDGPPVSESEVWAAKKATLDNLVLKKYDLDIWREGIMKAYKHMHYGRDVKDITPVTNIFDQAL